MKYSCCNLLSFKQRLQNIILLQGNLYNYQVSAYSISIMSESDSFQKDPVIKNSKQQSNFRAIKHLVQAQNSIRVAHNRIKVLKVNEEKNLSKLNNQVGLIGKIQQVRDFSTLHNHIVQTNKLQLQQQAELAKSKYLQLNSHHKEKIKQVYNDIQKSKKWLYLSTEEKSLEANREISESKIRYQNQKAKKRQKVAAEEQSGKKSLMQFYQTKQSRIQQTKMGQIETIKSKEAQKCKELKELSNIEMQLIQKQSQSQAAYQQVKKKLDSLLNTVKNQNTLSKKSLKASIHVDRENRIQL